MTEPSFSRRDVILMASGAGLLFAGGLVDGKINRSVFETPSGLADAVQRLQSVPAEFGGWTSVDETLSEREQNVAGIRGYLRRQYHNEGTGHRVGLTILCGPSGPMSVHPPTACFEGTGFRVATGPVFTSFDVETAPEPSEFNRSTFRRKGSRVPLQVRVFWGWGTTGDWSAPEHPRLAFRGLPWLYKLYVTDRWPSLDPKSAVPQADGFLIDALPVIRQALAADEPSSETAISGRSMAMLLGGSLFSEVQRKDAC